ncbi:hypothetical protein [Sulfitobacter sp. S190]|uniref:hypothetical protein n=1 Tax=Sulfitobacter sp. S190 TaxID=2867022 RepID=UPI0021A32C58|nr:hypothetical protein [Sulfitobacter sp. S190]UWR22957.1 hypothetical protein K3756_02855 [Sulfitobacter sp. S190]
MKTLRVPLALTLIAGLAACATPSIRATGDTTDLNVVSVSVDTDTMAQAVSGRASTVTKAQLDDDLTAALGAELAKASTPDGTPVTVAVTLTSVDLAPPVTRVAAAASSATGTVTVTEVGTDRTVVPATTLTGTSNSLRAPGVIGLATTQSVENDYRGTLSGFASTVRKALFGSEQ